MSFRFNDVHPATRLWWQQREQCEVCANHKLIEGAGGEAISQCSVTLIGTQMAYCIDARQPDYPCGPDARLFTPERNT